MHIHFKAIVVIIHVHCIIKVVQKKIFSDYTYMVYSVLVSEAGLWTR